MKTVRLGLIGFGNVGQGLAQILRDQGDEYASRYGLEFRIVGISDAKLGCIAQPAGYTPAQLLEYVTRHGTLHGLPGELPGWDALKLAQLPNDPQATTQGLGAAGLKKLVPK